MKITCYTVLIGLTCLLAAKAQTNTAAPTDTNAAPALALMETNNVAPTVVEAALAVTNVAAPAPESVPEAVAAVPAVAVGIPQIKFSDVPITTAIENLARLANINYMLDPRIGYGLPDANGQVKVEPTLSIRWENITAENALLALLDNYGLQLNHDKRTGIDRITMKDPTAPPPLFTKVVQLKYASVSNMIDSAQSVLTDKRSKVLTDTRTSQLVVVATDPEQQAVDALISQLDKPTRQVLIETRLIQITSTPTTQKGVDWSGTLQNQHVTFGNGNSVGSFTTTFPSAGGTDGPGESTGSSGVGTPTTVGTVLNTVGGGGFSWNSKSGTTPNVGFLNADGLSAVLSFLNTSADAQVMSTPRIVTLDNEEASINVTKGYPIFNTTAGTANTAGGSSITYSNVGTILNVTPRISANDYIWLKVLPVVSSFAGNFSQTIPNTGTSGGSSVVTAPTFETRTITTQVLIPNANTLVLGGLVQDSPTANYTKVPLLGDVPGLGFLFSSSNKSEDKENLLIFITPTIVKDTDFQTDSHSGSFLKSKSISMKDGMDPTKAWDSPVPGGNWSDPITPVDK